MDLLDVLNWVCKVALIAYAIVTMNNVNFYIRRENEKMEKFKTDISETIADYKAERMTVEDIVTKEGIDASFMSWLWNKDRQKYTLIMFGHLELITDDLVEEYFRESEDGK